MIKKQLSLFRFLVASIIQTIEEALEKNTSIAIGRFGSGLSIGNELEHFYQESEGMFVRRDDREVEQKIR